MTQNKIYIILFQRLLIQYREVLILFYVSLKKQNFEAALSLMSNIYTSENRILRILKNDKALQAIQFFFRSSNEFSNHKHDLQILLSKIILIQKKIEDIYKKKQSLINSYSNKSFYSKIDFLIKIFLQEKGL